MDYKNDQGNGYTNSLLCFMQLFIVSNESNTYYFANNNKEHFAFEKGKIRGGSTTPPGPNQAERPRFFRETTDRTVGNATRSKRKSRLVQTAGPVPTGISQPRESISCARRLTGSPTTVLQEPVTASTSTAPCPWMAYAPALSSGSPVAA